MSITPSPENAAALTGESAAETKRATATARAEATRKVARLKADIARQEAEIKAQREALDLELRRRQDEIETLMAPLRQEIAQLEEVAWTVDLYLGRDEEIELLVDGKPAPADTPITIRQMVLAMDEECLVNADDGGIDIRSARAFLDWMIADPAHRDRIIPDERGVVVLVASRQRREYGDAWFNARIDAENKTPHWIIRNGERLYLLVTGAERRGEAPLEVGKNLLPTRNEFVDLFYERSWGAGERKPMEPGSAAWVRAEGTASALQRHYMRIMLVLQGLVDRSVAFHPLPEGGVNLLSLSAQDSGAVRIIDETSMVLTDGRETFKQYQSRLNTLLRPGMRVIGNFGCEEWRSHRSGESYDTAHARLHPSRAPAPDSNVPYVITRRSGAGFVITYPRGKVYVDRYEHGRWVGERDSKTRASATLYPYDGFILPFDLVNTADLTRFLYSRTERKDYLHMVPVLRAAIEAKAAEARAEAPFRDLIVSTLATEHDLPEDEVRAQVEELVMWWKTGNKWFRPMQGDPEQESKAMRSIATEFAARRKIAADSSKDDVLVRVGRKVSGAIAVLTLRSGKTYAYAPAEPGEAVYLTRTEITAQGPSKVDEWVQVQSRTLSAARTLWATETWRDWNHAAVRGDHLTGPERQTLIEATIAALPGTPIVVLEQTRSEYGTGVARRFIGYAWKPDVDLSDLTEPEGRSHWDTTGIDARLDMVRMGWKRGPGGVIDFEQIETTRSPHWGTYAHEIDDPGGPSIFGTRKIGRNRPWLDPSSRYFRGNRAPVLVWSDPAQVQRVEEWQDAYEARQSEGRVGNNWQEAQVLRDAYKAAWMARLTAVERARFDEDFGAADDLWDHHLATLRLDSRFKVPGWLDSLSRRIANAGIAWDGKTIAQIVALDPTTDPLDAATFEADADLVLVRPEDDDEED